MGKILERLKGGEEDLDDEFLESYRNVLFGQYRSMSKLVEDPKAKEEADRIVGAEEGGGTNGPKKKVHWEDLYRLELAIVKLEPIELLRRRAWILRQEYEEVASVEEVKAYHASKPPDIQDSKEPELRADCVRLQEELNWRYIVLWVLADFRSRLVARTTKYCILFIIFAAIAASASFSGIPGIRALNLNVPFLVLIVIPGVVGGFISTMQRLQKAKFDGNADLDLGTLDENASIYLSPFLGGVFAFLLFCLFAGGLIRGDMFPKVTFDNLLMGGQEELDFAQIASLVVWLFIAGFAERFVPDRLEKLTQSTPTTTTDAKSAARK